MNSVLEAVRRLLEEEKFQDVHFRCSDGRLVSSNRAFLAARCEYFERLLFGSLKESSCREIRLHASSEAFRHVLIHLHTGHFGSIEQEACWITLMEASSLAQQYILPGMVQHVADRLSADLRPENLGLALSHALKNDLQAVIKSIWIALPRLLSRPFALDRSFSADAICFCLQHTAWMATKAAGSGGNSTPAASSSTAAAAAGSNTHALAGEASGTAVARDLASMHRASSINGASEAGAGGALSRSAPYTPGSSRSAQDSSAAQEAQAFSAVLEWMMQEVAGCADCQAMRQVSCRETAIVCSSGAACRTISTPPSGATTPRAAVPDVSVHSSSFGHHVPSAQAVAASAQPASPCSMQRACSAGQANAGASAAAAGGSRAAGSAGADLSRSCSLSPSPMLGESSQPCLHPAMQSSRHNLQNLQVQHQHGTSASAGRGFVGRLSSHSVRSSYESDTSEGEADIRSHRSSATAGSSSTHAGFVAASFPAASLGSDASAPVAAVAASSVAEGAAGVQAQAGSGGVDAGAPAAVDTAAGPALQAATATPDAQQQQPEEAAEPELVYSGCCCVGHQGMLLQMLAHLNWHLLDPKLLDKLDSLALLGSAALLEIFRAHQRCCHVAQWGNFPSLSLGSERGLRCYTTGGEQVLECESVSHLTATSTLCFTSGKHCWQFVVAVPCDLVWLGLSDGSLSPDVWGGKQPGGWFYGSNDALCHNKQSDRHAYTKHCGNGKWGDGAVVDVCLDMDAREVWFGVDGAEPKLGFSGLPDRVYPAVSLRAPAQLLVRFRAASWIMSEAQHA